MSCKHTYKADEKNNNYCWICLPLLCWVQVPDADISAPEVGAGSLPSADVNVSGPSGSLDLPGELLLYIEKMC